MKGHNWRRLVLLSLPVFLAVGLPGCTDEDIVYEDKPVYDDPPESARGFVGYTLTGADPGNEMPACSNCHVGASSEWEGTDHADAWATLEASGHAEEFCRGCHSVSEFGNIATEPSGYTGSGDSIRYKDVQCESCHGPGLSHVEIPDGSRPLASMVVSVNATNGCGECHQGTHHPFVEQWATSAHGSVTPYAAAEPSCNGCHSGNGVLVRWGINANYTEKESLGPGDYIDITCGVCHDPHGSPYEGQLRFPVNTNDLDRHLCADCHDRRSVPEPGSAHGLFPHAPEKALLAGEAGFFFPGMEIDIGQIVGTHGSVANPRLCAGCHVDRWEVTSPETGDFAFQNVGHTFNSIPCVEDGVDSGESECRLSTETRYFGACATSGCHGSEAAAFSVLVSAADLHRGLAGEVARLLEQVPDGEINPYDPIITTAEGALFNYGLAAFGEGREGVEVSPLLAYTGSATHNPFLVRSLLIASIEALKKEYGLTASDSYEGYARENATLMPRWTGR